VTIGVIGDRLSYSELLGAGRHLLLDPKSGSITPLPSDAERIADNFWSPSDRRLTSGATDAVLFAATAPATPSTSLHVAGDGRTVWEIRRNTCVEPGDLEVVVHKASGDTTLGCRPLRADKIVRVGKTAAIALVASAAVKILRP
jgi:hypothetical protein